MSIMQESEAKGNPYPLKIEGQGSWSVEDTFLERKNMKEKLYTIELHDA